MHGFFDIIPMFVEFAELLAGGGINVMGWLSKALCADEKMVDAFIQDTFDAYHKYTGMGTGKGVSGALFAGGESLFGRWDKATTLQGSHFATKGTDKERTIGDFFGVGKRSDKIGGMEAAAEAWSSWFDLRYEEDKGSAVSDMQDPAKVEANRKKWDKRKKEGDKWLEENIPGVKFLNSLSPEKPLHVLFMEAIEENNKAILQWQRQSAEKGFVIDNRSSPQINQYVYPTKESTSELKEK